MATTGVSFQEVCTNQTHTLRWKEICINSGVGIGSGAGNSRSPDNGGGYAYRDSGKAGSPCRNRFIYWHTHNEVLELVEASLDLNLTGNCVRFRFQDSPIVGDVTIHETHGSVFVLVTTISSVHRLIFPHPNRLQKFDHTYLQSVDQAIPSVFTEASVAGAQDAANIYHFNELGVTHTIRTGAGWLEGDGHAVFALAATGTNNAVVMIKLPPFGSRGAVETCELKTSSMIGRLWSGLPSMFRGQGQDDTTVDLTLHPVERDTLIFAVCQDLQLRVWSTYSRECVFVQALLDTRPDDAFQGNLGDGKHLVKRCIGPGGHVRVAVYLSLGNNARIQVYDVTMESGRCVLEEVTRVFWAEGSLVKLHITPSKLWAVSSNKGDMKCNWTQIDGEGQIDGWQSVKMEATEPEELPVYSYQDPRETFLDHIFTPGRFSVQVILKALSLYRRSLDATYLPDTIVPTQALRHEVLNAVQHEVHQSAGEYEMTDSEFHNLQLEQWRKFYSGCVQYQQRECRPTGIFTDNMTGVVAVVKKENVSFARPISTPEHFYYGGQQTCGLEPDLHTSLLNVSDILAILQNLLNRDAVFCFEQDLYHTQSPLEITANLNASLLQDPALDRDGLMEAQETPTQDLMLGLEYFIQELDVTMQSPDIPPLITDDHVVDEARLLATSRLFTSGYGVDIVSGAVTQYISTRLCICRDLLLLINQRTDHGLNEGENAAGLDRLKEMGHKISLFTQAFYAMKWFATTEAMAPPVSTVDINMRQLEALELSEIQTATGQQKSSVYSGDQSRTLLEVFLMGQYGEKVREILSDYALAEEESSAIWNKALSAVVTIVAQYLWPLSGEFKIPEFLLSQCQYLQLQEYVRITRNWIIDNVASLQFILALSYLNCNEPEKALEGFLEAAEGVNTGETFLLNLLQEDAENQAHLEVLYYIKAISVVEQHGDASLVVSLARTAISIAQPGDPNKATLWSKVFKYELELGHNQEAYNAMLANPDASRRKDCLRQFVVVLCERRELKTLVSLPYRDKHTVLEEEVVNILESRARSIDLTTHNYYDLLYAFHVARGNWRKAGSIMYEYGMRLGQEVPGVRGLQNQAKCYLAAMNALEIVDKTNAWIVKPLPQTSQPDELKGSAKHTVRGEIIEKSMKRRVEVLGPDDIEKEYALIHARLELLKHDTDPSHKTGPTPSAGETVVLLVNAGLFDSAVKVCEQFDMPFSPVFEGLASRCVNLAENSAPHMMSDNDYTSTAWKWLQQNTLPRANATRDNCSTEHAWRLLQEYINKYGDVHTQYHKCVAVKFLSQGFSLPSWLIAPYKRLNGAELLRLYLNYDRVEDAAHLAIEYIEAVMGKGSELFGIKEYMRCGAVPLWLPYTSIDQLMAVLQDMDTDPTYQQLAEDLHKRLQQYLATVEEVSGDTIATKQRAASTNTSIFMSGQVR